MPEPIGWPEEIDSNHMQANVYYRGFTFRHDPGRSVSEYWQITPDGDPAHTMHSCATVLEAKQWVDNHVGPIENNEE